MKNFSPPPYSTALWRPLSILSGYLAISFLPYVARKRYKVSLSSVLRADYSAPQILFTFWSAVFARTMSIILGKVAQSSAGPWRQAFWGKSYS